MSWISVKHKIISLIPIQGLKQAIYRNMGYKIGQDVFIGRSIIHCKEVIIGDGVTIYSGNIIRVNRFELGKGSSILSGNRIVGSADFYLGENGRIIYDHYIDVWNDVTLGDDTWLAGKDSQIWTHGSIHTKVGKDLSVDIGDRVYLSSAVRIAPGIKIASDNLIGLGCVVSSAIEKRNCIMSGNPGQIIKENINWRKNW